LQAILKVFNIKSKYCDKTIQNNPTSSGVDKKVFKHSLFVYGKDNIADLLVLAGATKTAIVMHQEIAKNEANQHINRGVNCNLANIEKMVDFCVSSIEWCKNLSKSNLYNNLDKNLKNTIMARLDNPEDSLSQLANILGVSKSCVKHRLYKLKLMASNLI